MTTTHDAGAVRQAVRERYERVHALVDHDPADVEATRAWVHAYVEYIHLVEHILEATGHGEGEGS